MFPVKKYWHAGGSILCHAENAGIKAVVFVENDELPDLIAWYTANDPGGSAACDLAEAIEAREQYLRVMAVA